jgi:hypothetical protein
VAAGAAAAGQAVQVDVRTEFEIWGFAFDGDRMAWSTGGEIRTKLVGQERSRLVGDEAQNQGDYVVLDGWLEMAVAGKRVLWGGTGECCNHGYGEVNVATVGGRPRSIDGFIQGYHVYDDFLFVAGDGQTLVYAITTVPIIEDLDGCYSIEGECCLYDGCMVQVSEGRVERIVAGRPVRVADVPAVALLAVSTGRLAVVPADLTPSEEMKRPRPTDIVVILDAASGDVISEYRASAPITALAFSGPRGAVLVSDAGSKHLEWFDAAGGQQLGRVEVAANAVDIDLAGTRLVYRGKPSG